MWLDFSPRIAVPASLTLLIVGNILLSVEANANLENDGLNTKPSNIPGDNPFERNQAIQFSWNDPAIQGRLGIIKSEHSFAKRGSVFGPAIVIPSCLGCAGGARGGDSPCEIIQNLWPDIAHIGNLEKRATQDRLETARTCRLNGPNYDIPLFWSWTYPSSGDLKNRPGAAFGYFDNDWKQGCKYWGLVETPSAQTLAGEERDYVSEHILELNSIPIFFDELALEEGKEQCTAILQMFFAGNDQTKWNIGRLMGLFPHIGKIPGFPSIKKDYVGEMPILESRLNGIKMHMWQRISLNDQVDFSDITLNGLDHMQALREIALVWQYMNHEHVASSLIDQWERISDLFNELEKNTQPLAAHGITKTWTEWMKYQLNTMAENTESFVQVAINKIAENENKYPSDEYISIIADQRKNGLLRKDVMKFSRIGDIKR